MDKIPFQDGTKISSAKVTIDGVDYPVTPARYTGATPLSSVVMNAMQTNIENAINQNVDNIGGEEYDNTATYEEGDIVKYQGQLYICIEAIDTPEEWDSTKWDATDVLSSAGGNEVTIGTSADITSKTKIFIDEEEGTDAYSEVVNSLSGNEIAKAPSVRAVNEALSYSTDEVRIGTWIDGKPLYRKAFTGTRTTANGDIQLVENVDNIIKNNIIFRATNGQFMYFDSYKAGDNDFLQFYFRFSGTMLILGYRCGTSYPGANGNYNITLEYTKTTD